ncbi:MAG: hypothetical protein IKE52_03375 [Mogibacterium sp.]|nr:hypothetical protein [Mogibacterium sp.]
MSIRENQWRKVVEILQKLEETGCLEHMMLIGSWADYLYSASGFLPDYESRIRTLDLDFLICNARKPNPPKDASALFKELGFIVETDRITGVTKLFDTATGFEVEFLIQMLGSGTERYMKTNLGVTAQAMREFSILANNRIEISYLGMKVSVPKPEAYIINKMVINDERSEFKADKDRSTILNMYHHIDKEEFERIREGLTKKYKSRVQEFMDEFIQSS